MSETSSAKDCRIDLRVTQEQKELLERAASLKGISLSAYTLFHVLPVAKQDIDANERLVLSNFDRDLFMSVMENPPELKGKLKSAIHKYRQKYDN
ncbi:type II toxin-antitoxin system TacA family antitoxin [Nostoc sp.]|uniref:type II toxin-antitoxin system TacA family antitoxin n=1 Tax=Nostoc sp. TaxID=1180 RepID=UPI002FFB20A6